MKYIRFAGMPPNFHLFGDHEQHSEVADRLMAEQPLRVVSAGFVGLGVCGPYCHGESISLECKIRHEDTEHLRALFYD